MSDRRPSRRAAGAALAAAAVLVLVLVAPVPEPFGPAREAVDALGAWTYVLLGAVVFLETTVGLGMLAPGEVLIAVCGAAAATGALDPVALVVVALACGVAGDTASWALGHRHGAAVLVRLGARVGLRAERVADVGARVARSGGWVLVAGRFVGPVRVLAPFLTGAGGMRLRTFLPFDVAGIALWAGTYLGIGFAFAGALETASDRVTQVGLAVLAAGVAGVLVARRTGAPGGMPTPERAVS